MLRLIISDRSTISETDRRWLREKLKKAFAKAGGIDSLECAVLLTDDDELRQLNRDYRGLDEPTDVLSFAGQEAENAEVDSDWLGDIAISVEYATRLVASGEHHERVRSELGLELIWNLRLEILFLGIHGVLHLLGYDHCEAEDEIEMKMKEREVLTAVLSRRKSSTIR